MNFVVTILIAISIVLAACTEAEQASVRRGGSRILTTDGSPSPSPTPSLLPMQVTAEGQTSEGLSAEFRKTKINVPPNALDNQQVKLIRATLRDVSANADDPTVILAGGSEVIETMLTDGADNLILMSQIKEDITVTREIQDDTNRYDLMVTDGSNNYYVKQENLKKSEGSSLWLWSLIAGTRTIEFRIPSDIPSQIQSAKFKFWFHDQSLAQYAAFAEFVPEEFREIPDTTAPTILNVSATNADGNLAIGEVVNVTVRYSEAVTVVGVPTLTLETGSTDRAASYATGSGTDTLTFAYTVSNGDETADLDYVAVNSLNLGAATITDAAGNAANNALPVPGGAGSLGANKALVVSTAVPVVTSVTSTSANGTYKAGQVINVRVVFSAPVNVTGIPYVTLEAGGLGRPATYSSGSGTNNIDFAYTVISGDISADLDYISLNYFNDNSGTIKSLQGVDALLTFPAPGAPGSLGANKAIVVDAVVPTVSSLSSTSANGSYKLGQNVVVTVTFSESVSVTGTPQLTLETGTMDRTASYTSGSGSNTLSFTYTVQSADASGDLDAFSTNALALNGGTIRDVALNDATLTLPTPGQTNSLGANKDIVIDGNVPNVTGVSSSTANGTYKTGDALTITVSFSEAVTVTGTPLLTLETGAIDHQASYVSGSGTSTLSFTYTVLVDDATGDLDYASTSALATAGGSIADAAGNAATLTLVTPGSAGSLGSSKAIVLDGVSPTVTGVTSSQANGTYVAGSSIDVTVSFSEVVTVTGAPQLLLETGSVDRNATYTTGSGSNTLSFSYTVQTGDASADLDFVSTTSLTLNGGTIKDGANNAATLTLPSPGQSGSLGANKALVIDAVVPTVSSVSASTANGTYKVGDAISVTVTFSENVNVTGTPLLTLETGTTDRDASYASGSGTNVLTFSYTVQSGDASADLDATGTTSLVLNSGTIKDAANNSATLTLPTPGQTNSLGANKALVIDGVVPTVSSVSSSTANGTYIVGDTISITVSFSENVTVTGTPLLTLETGTTDRNATYASGSGSGVLTFSYTVQSGDTSADLDATGTSSLSLNSGTIKDSANNAATLTLPTPGQSGSLGSNKALVIDGAVPTVTSLSASTANGSYKVGDAISITITFSENVVVTGTPLLTLETGTTDRDASYASGSGTNVLTFSYSVQSGDETSDLDATGTSSLALNSGTIKDSSNNAATLTLPTPGQTNSLGANKALVIDGVLPTVSSVSSSTSNGAYKAADSIAVTVTFSENVTVTGTPLLTLETGTTDRDATYASGTGTSVLTFNYSVQTGDTSADLDVTGVGALTLNGGTIKDSANNNAFLPVPSPGGANSLGNNKNIKIDTTAPPALDAFTVTGGAGKATIDLDYPASVTDLAHVIVRRAAGATAPASNCTDGTQVFDRTTFSPDTYSYNDTLSAGTYSYRVCITDTAGNLTSSQTQANITVSAGAPTWKSSATWTVSNTMINWGVGIGTGDKAGFAAVLDIDGANQDAYYRQYVSNSWDSSDTQADSESGLISGIGIGYDSSGNPVVVRGFGSGACKSGSTSMSMDGIGCDAIQGPSGKVAAGSVIDKTGLPSSVPGLRFFDGSIWNGTNTSLPTNQIPAFWRYDASGTFWGLLHDVSTFDYTVRKWNGSSWVDEGITISSNQSMIDVSYAVSSSNAMIVAYGTEVSMNDNRIYARRRDTSSTWQSIATIASLSAGVPAVTGIDTNGKIIVAWHTNNATVSFKKFDGSSWDVAPTQLSSTSSAGTLQACSHPSSNKIFVGWIEGTGTSSALMLRVFVDGALQTGAAEYEYNPTSQPEVVADFKMTCNATGYAAAVVKLTPSTGTSKGYGGIVYMP